MATIGLFDSGVGGLTLVREVERQMPRSVLVYYGDGGRSPYGPLPRETILTYSREALDFLGSVGVDLAIIACNTATAASLDAVRGAYPFPVLGVVGGGVRGGLSTTRNKRIGVIGTQFTIESGAYERALKEIDPSVHVFGRACPSFTTLAERGISSGREVDAAAATYLAFFEESGIDTLILGCTHYPILIEAIRRHLHPSVALVDPAEETVAEAKAMLQEMGVPLDSTAPSRHFHTSGDPGLFSRMARFVLGYTPDDVRRQALSL